MPNIAPGEKFLEVNTQLFEKEHPGSQDKPTMKGYVRDFIRALRDQGLPADQVTRFADQVMQVLHSGSIARSQWTYGKSGERSLGKPEGPVKLRQLRAVDKDSKLAAEDIKHFQDLTTSVPQGIAARIQFAHFIDDTCIPFLFYMIFVV
jgi:hypothetical protein